MGSPIKEDTAFTMEFGPVVDSNGDIVTTITSVTLVLIKNGTYSTQASFTVTHVGNGVYNGTGTSTHSNTAGRLTIGWAESASYLVASTFKDYDVERVEHYDTRFASGNMPSDIIANTLGVSTFDHTSHQVIVGTNNAKTGYTLTSADHNLIAEALLKLDLSTVTGEASRSVLNAIRAIRNKFTTTAGTYTVMKEDDATTAWSATYATDAAAEKIVSRG